MLKLLKEKGYRVTERTTLKKISSDTHAHSRAAQQPDMTDDADDKATVKTPSKR